MNKLTIVINGKGGVGKDVLVNEYLSIETFMNLFRFKFGKVQSCLKT